MDLLTALYLYPQVTVSCPLGKMRMRVPCRPQTCGHLQCFDAATFLQMNERKPTWNCPVCDSKANYSDLLIDGYFQEVLESKVIVCLFVEEINFSITYAMVFFSVFSKKANLNQNEI